jgi:hypothetical protein
LVQGILLGHVENRGVLMLDATVLGGLVKGPGRVISMDDVPPEYRDGLPRIEMRVA